MIQRNGRQVVGFGFSPQIGHQEEILEDAVETTLLGGVLGGVVTGAGGAVLAHCLGAPMWGTVVVGLVGATIGVPVGIGIGGMIGATQAVDSARAMGPLAAEHELEIAELDPWL